MPFARPTLQDLITRVEGDYKSGLGLLNLLRRSFLKVAARANAGLSYLLFGYLDYIQREAMPDTAEDTLSDKAAIYGVERKPATFGEFTLTATGTAGTTVPALTPYRRSDGKEYLVQEDAALPAALTLRAKEAGKDYAVEVGDTLTVAETIAGLDAAGTVATITTDPDDAEELEDFRSRYLDRVRNPPSGGAANDYIQWAEAVAGVTRAWVKPQGLGPGTVVVYVVNDAASPISADAGLLAAVTAALADLQPVTANVSVATPVLDALSLTIQLKPNTAAVRAAVTAELQDLILRDAQVAGSYSGPGATNSGKILLSRLNESISIAANEEDHAITVVNGGAPADITPATGHLVVLGTITWQTLA